MNKFKKFFIIKKFKSKYSFSQSGEDIIVDYLFKLKKINKPNYLDIGAYHPFFLNNTALFYLKGSSGINIDANNDIIRLLDKYRPKDINLCFAIGESNSTVNYFEFSDPALNTTDNDAAKELTRNWEKGYLKYKLIKKKVINSIPIKEIINKYFQDSKLDLLNIDTEGLDAKIVKSFPFQIIKPKVIIVETALHSPDGTGDKNNSIHNYLNTQNYFLYADTFLNSIFVDIDFWKL